MVNGYLNKFRYIVYAGITLVALFLILPTPLKAENKTSDSGVILVIASYNPDTKRMSSFISEFEHSIVAEKLPYEILIEDLGCKGFSEAPAWSERIENILNRYKESNLKAIILLGQEAWASFLAHGDIPTDIPFFGCFASTNGIRLPSGDAALEKEWSPEYVDMMAWADSLGMAGGCLNRYDIGKNIELVRTLYPDINNIAFVSDNTYGGISLQALIRKEMKRYPDLNLILIDGRDGEGQAAEDIRKLPPNTVMLIGTWRVGQDGQYLMYSSMRNLVASNPAVPVFSITGSEIGSTAIGGYVPTYENGALQIAVQIADFYKKRTDSIHFESTNGEYRFDLKKLNEFGIAEYRLPSGSIVTDSMEAQLQKYEYYIYVGLTVLVVLSLFLIFVYFLYYKNKRLKIILQNREVELIQAKEKAEESDHLKSAFLANMSHEIRTPLNAIVGFSTLLGEQSISKEERDEYNSIVSKNSTLLLTLIGDILDISRLETDKINFTYKEEDAIAICQQVISTTTYSRKTGVECNLEHSVDSFILETDGQRLSQVLINLMTNASKFTEQGTITMAVSVLEKENKVEFSVTDTGSGIPKEKQSKVFNRFEKLNEFKQGTGLGLAICKQIVMKLGGDIWVDPDYTGGARFVFTHPIRREKQ